MSARWQERQDGRDAGQAAEEPAGCPVLVVVAVMIFAALYFAVRVLLWIIQAVG